MARYNGSTLITGGQAHLGDIHNTHHHHHYEFRNAILHCDKRTLHTGSWLIEDSRFQTWLTVDREAPHVLWCHGNPGSGKTILCSMVIEHVQTILNEGEAAAYCFFDYARRRDLVADAVIAEIIVQLSLKHSEICQPIIFRLYNDAEKGRRRPTMREITQAFHEIANKIQSLTLVVDALDECDHAVRRQFLTALDLAANPNIRLLIFSRPHIQLSSYFAPSAMSITQLEVQAHTPDLQAFLDARIAESEDLEWIIRRCSITNQQITNQIIERADSRSFLAAEMRMNAIQYALTSEDLSVALEAGVSDLTELYSETLTRITGQTRTKGDLAIKVLGWLSHVKRPLTMRELCHALGVELAGPIFSWERTPAAETVLNCCCGLVIQDQHTEQVRLLHYTLLEFLEGHVPMSINHQTIVETCINCLSIPEMDGLARSACLRASKLAALQLHIVRTVPFTIYAALYWSAHMSSDLTKLDSVASFLSTGSKVSSWLEVVKFHNPKQYKEILNCRIFNENPLLDPYLGLRIAIYAGWPQVVQLIVQATSCDRALGETLRRIMLIKSTSLLKSVISSGCVSTNIDSLLRQAVDLEFIEAIPLLVDSGADLNQQIDGLTLLQRCLMNVKEATSRTLIDSGASVTCVDKEGNTLLHLASEHYFSSRVIQALLDRGLKADTCNRLGQTAVHKALESIHVKDRKDIYSTLGTLLENGANANLTTATGKTPLYYAWVNHHSYAVIAKLISYGADITVRSHFGVSFLKLCQNSGHLHFQRQQLDSFVLLCAKNKSARDHALSSGKSLLHWAIERDVPDHILNKVLGDHDFVNPVDSVGRTPLHLAIQLDRIAAVKILLRAGANIELPESECQSALHLAIEHRASQSLQILLLNHGNSIFARNREGRSALDIFVTNPGHEDVLDWVLPTIYPTRRRLTDGNTLIGGVVLIGYSIGRLEIILKHCIEDINSQDDDHNTALIIAAKLNKRQTVRKLLEYGANVHLHNKAGFSALHEAIINRNFRGPDITYFQEDHDLAIKDAIETIGASRASELVITQLLRHGADVDDVDASGRTALHLAINTGMTMEQIQPILDRAENLDLRTQNGCTALHYIVIRMLLGSGQRDLAKGQAMLTKLIERGADIDALCDTGTVLHLSAMSFSRSGRRALEVQHMLLSHFDADPHIRNNDGRTALDILKEGILQKWSENMERKDEEVCTMPSRLRRSISCQW